MSMLFLKEFRKAAKMTQEEVSEVLKISQAQYSRLEKGKSVLDAKQILILCELFGCSPNDLFGFKGALSVVIDPLFEDYKKLVAKIKKE